MPKVTKINHVAIVVSDLEDALSFWRDCLGIDPGCLEDVPEQEAQIAMLPVGDSTIELVRPTSTESGVGKYLAKYGGGMHHLSLEVDSIEGMIECLLSKGIRLINETPIEMEGRKAAFIHPKSANGVLVELYELTK